ncbi:MAG: hypothetical protein F6K28_03270 [Microcoleus sp. SIO2G3]|nr:hypothetical protein [Microcoleus sp. SIO2G3]
MRSVSGELSGRSACHHAFGGIRGAMARSAAPLGAIAQIVHNISSDDAFGWFAHCGLFI